MDGGAQTVHELGAVRPLLLCGCRQTVHRTGRTLAAGCVWGPTACVYVGAARSLAGWPCAFPHGGCNCRVHNSGSRCVCVCPCLCMCTQVAAPMVVGMLAFGGKWDSLLGLDPTGLYPIKVAEDHTVTAKKVRSCEGGEGSGGAAAACSKVVVRDQGYVQLAVGAACIRGVRSCAAPPSTACWKTSAEVVSLPCLHSPTCPHTRPVAQSCTYASHPLPLRRRPLCTELCQQQLAAVALHRLAGAPERHKAAARLQPERSRGPAPRSSRRQCQCQCGLCPAALRGQLH